MSHSPVDAVSTRTDPGQGPVALLSAPAPDRLARETVAVVIPTLNAEASLRRTLESVTWADEIVIVDMFSTDGTLGICQEYPNVRLFQRIDYIFANVNFGMEQARTDWVIRLDSDEVLNEELQHSIQHVLAHPEPDVSGYSFPSIQYMFGLPMQYGPGLRERNIRKCMFRRGTARYACQSEHEDIITSVSSQ
jgi:glycosyltransferase involved in cell wall biosynthesis